MIRAIGRWIEWQLRLRSCRAGIALSASGGGTTPWSTFPVRRLSPAMEAVAPFAAKQTK